VPELARRSPACGCATPRGEVHIRYPGRTDVLPALFDPGHHHPRVRRWSPNRVPIGAGGMVAARHLKSAKSKGVCRAGWWSIPAMPNAFHRQERTGCLQITAQIAAPRHGCKPADIFLAPPARSASL